MKDKLIKTVKLLKKNGVRNTAKIIYDTIYSKSAGTRYLRRNRPSKKRLKRECSTNFEYSPKISIVVPLYNTPKDFLCEMIDSVLSQSYANWELCMADGSDEQHSYVEELCVSYAKHTKQIKYLKLEENYGISGNSNKSLELASGEYIALLDHDDVLHPSVLFDVVSELNKEKVDFIYTDECSFAKDLKHPTNIHFKPDYSPDTLRSHNYICHFSVFSRNLLDKTGGFDSRFDGSQDYDLILRLTEIANKVVHIPRVLYYWRAHENSVALAAKAKPYCKTAAKLALAEHLKRIGLKGDVCVSTVLENTYKINYEIQGEPLISILIPNKDHVEDLDRCLKSILDKSSYKNIEIFIIENNSTDSATFDYYERINKDARINILKYNGKFNYSKINNFAAEKANGDYLLLLNNDTEIISENWIEEMLMFAQREDVGAVGAKLYYPDDTIQHAGVLMGINYAAGHAHKGWERRSVGYFDRLVIAQNMSGVTGACIMMRKEVFDEVNGFDEEFPVDLNDVDLCLRIRNNGYLIIFTPYAEAYHYESKSRGYMKESKEKFDIFNRAVKRLQSKWSYELEHDPYYNINLSLSSESFAIK